MFCPASYVILSRNVPTPQKKRTEKMGEPKILQIKYSADCVYVSKPKIILNFTLEMIH